MYENNKTYNVIKGKVPDFSVSDGDIMLAFTTDGMESTKFPNKNSGYIVNKITCNNGITADWDNISWSLTNINNSNNAKKVICTIDFVHGQEYEYVGKEQTFTAKLSGKYKLEVWGASGGTMVEGTAGYGGYAVGEINLTQNQTLYVNVGGIPTGTIGGYNGGGNGGVGNNQWNYGGGGATHIATETGLLASLKTKTDSVLIVAGGGGAGVGSIVSDVLPGSGGGYMGVNGSNRGGGSDFSGSGATQTQGGGDRSYRECGLGSFGQGGNFCNGGYGGAGGGGGFYGGGGGSRAHASGGGGSGYIGNELLTNKIMWCYNCTESEDEKTKTKTTTNVSEEATSEYAKQGNGYAKITYLGK